MVHSSPGSAPVTVGLRQSCERRMYGGSPDTHAVPVCRRPAAFSTGARAVQSRCGSSSRRASCSHRCRAHREEVHSAPSSSPHPQWQQLARQVTHIPAPAPSPITPTPATQRKPPWLAMDWTLYVRLKPVSASTGCSCCGGARGVRRCVARCRSRPASQRYHCRTAAIPRGAT